jgi:hypothetical protein
MLSTRRAALVCTGVVCLLVGCQDTSTVGVRNGCSAAIEAVADESPQFPDYLDFELIQPGEVRQVVAVSEVWDTLWVWVRTSGEQSVGSRLSVSRPEVPQGGNGQPDLVVDVAGVSCP